MGDAIEEKQMKIFLETNAGATGPSSSNSNQNPNLQLGGSGGTVLTSSLLDGIDATHLGILSKYPYFTSKRKFPKMILEKKPYAERLQFFFQPQTFRRILLESAESTSKDPLEDVASYNLQLLIALLFPISSPVPQQHQTSYHMCITETSSKEDAVAQSTLVPLDHKYAYVKLPSGSTSTVLRTMILDDVVNHPVYHPLVFENYPEFADWRARQKKILEDKLSQDLNEVEKQVTLMKDRGNLDNLKVALEAMPRNKTKLLEIDKHIRYFKDILLVDPKSYNFHLPNPIQDKEWKRKFLEAPDEETEKVEPQMHPELDKWIVLKHHFQTIAQTKTKDTLKITPQTQTAIDVLIKRMNEFSVCRTIWKRYFQDPLQLNTRFDEDREAVKTYMKDKYKPYLEYVEGLKRIRGRSTLGDFQNKLDSLFYVGLSTPPTTTTTPSPPTPWIEYCENMRQLNLADRGSLTTELESKMKCGGVITLKPIDPTTTNTTIKPPPGPGPGPSLIGGAPGDDPYPRAQPPPTTKHREDLKIGFEAHVYVELVGGKLSDEIIGKLGCVWKDVHLGISFQKLRETQTFQYQSTWNKFYTIRELESQVVTNPPKPPPPQNNPNPNPKPPGNPPPLPKQRLGGRRRRRRQTRRLFRLRKYTIPSITRKKKRNGKRVFRL